MKKNGETLQHLNIAEHISDLIFCKKVYTSDVDVWLKIEKLNVDKTYPSWEPSPGYFFRYHTTRPP